MMPELSGTDPRPPPSHNELLPQWEIAQVAPWGPPYGKSGDTLEFLLNHPFLI